MSLALRTVVHSLQLAKVAVFRKRPGDVQSSRRPDFAAAKTVRQQQHGERYDKHP